MSLIEQPGQEIVVPSSLPMILKQFCKAAIRTQPYDLLKWSSSYFRALAEGEEPPSKMRLEYPPPSTASGLTLGFLRVLLRQLGDYNKSLPVETILRRWDCLCLDRRDLNLIMMIGKFRRMCQVKKFLAIAVGLLGSSLFETMIMICELFTREPDGGSAMIPVTLFMEIYGVRFGLKYVEKMQPSGYLAGLRCDGTERDSSDEDPTEFIICDESCNIESLGLNEPVDDVRPDVNRVCSIASQDTEADVNFDLELVSKDADSSRTDASPQLTESSNTHKEVVEKIGKDSPTDDTFKGKGSRTSPVEDKKHKTSRSIDEASNKSEKISGKRASTCSEENSQNHQSVRNAGSSSERGKRRIGDTKWMKYYPNAPGIGPRLSAEEVASVAIWMSECARLQEGMVGPRNMRHMNCPPLDRQELSESLRVP